MSEIQLTKCMFCDTYSQCETFHIYDPVLFEHITGPVCPSCKRMYFVGRSEAQEVLGEWESEEECPQLKS